MLFMILKKGKNRSRIATTSLFIHNEHKSYIACFAMFKRKIISPYNYLISVNVKTDIDLSYKILKILL